jgi:NAD(P)H-flavin reductase/hemoglobin-like flavoprotein
MEQYDDRPLEDDFPLLDESLRLIHDRSDHAVNYFYAALFLERPDLRALFPAAMDTQRDRLFKALTGIVRNLNEQDRVIPMLEQLGRDHRKYGVRPDHYAALGRALIAAMEKYCDDVWVPELQTAWERAYTFMARTMIDGAQEAATREPAWWKADIIAHERRADDIAVITLRTDRPYSYTAGQFASIETPYRPRSWRTYSMATAPSPDGLVEFHVRALGHGWVSGPLVWRATVGDVLKLGAPMGEMSVDQQSRRDILCIAGGTGLAPIKAMVDDMSKWNTARKVHVFFGVRRPGDLYDIGALHRLAAMNPWLTVTPAVSDEPTFPGERGMLPDVVERHGDWREHDVFVCGSPDMTRSTLTRLSELGVPESRISYDVAGDEHPASAQVIDLRRTRQSRERASTGWDR